MPSSDTSEEVAVAALVFVEVGLPLGRDAANRFGGFVEEDDPMESS
jgi:hypothetical protein